MSKILFLPDNYEAPRGASFYMKLQEGENKFRILSRPILGWEDWQDKKPIRFRFNEKPAKPVDPKKPIKHFWSMIVWNYNEEEIQILHLTQATIRKSLEALCSDSDWGSPYFYDLKILKSGEGMETEYALNPIPHKALHPMIQDRFNERRCNLDALFDNDDPFSKENTHFTEGVFSQDQIKQENKPCELTMVLEDCDPNYKDWFNTRLKTHYKVSKPIDLPTDIYDRCLIAAKKHMDDYHTRQRAEFDSQGIAEGVS
jgi:hypothetical protein